MEIEKKIIRPWTPAIERINRGVVRIVVVIMVLFWLALAIGLGSGIYALVVRDINLLEFLGITVGVGLTVVLSSLLVSTLLRISLWIVDGFRNRVP